VGRTPRIPAGQGPRGVTLAGYGFGPKEGMEDFCRVHIVRPDRPGRHTERLAQSPASTYQKRQCGV